MIDASGTDFLECGERPSTDWLELCGDIELDAPQPQKKGKRKTGRAYRRQMRAQKFNRQKNIALYYNSSALRVGIDRGGPPDSHPLWRFGIDDDYVRYTYIRRPKSSKYKKFYKNYSNKVVRRSAGSIPKGSQHRKLFDLWWALV